MASTLRAPSPGTVAAAVVALAPTAALAIDFAGAQFGMIQTLKTGDQRVDMALCLVIPALFAWALSSWEQRIHPFLVGIWIKWGKWAGPTEHRREIEYEVRQNSWGSMITGADEKNNILQKAITLYLASKNPEYKVATTSLMSLSAKNRRWYDDDEDDSGGKNKGLKAFRLTTVAPHGQWVDVSEDVEFMQSSSENTEGEETKINKKKIIFMFRSFVKDGHKKIDDFIAAAWKFYLDELDKNKDSARYMYNMIAKDPFASKSDSDDNETTKYKRYKLSDEKTFDSLFFPEREKILQLLDHFKEKSGKYAISGYPHKLGLLLHGPPGTGKTSLIKALANATGRSIVNIPLARIKTNQELTDLVYDLKFSVPGEDVPIKLQYKDIIFVMEDVDAASKIVHKRSAGAGGTTSFEYKKTEATEDGVSTTTLKRSTSRAPEADGTSDGLDDDDGDDETPLVAGPALPDDDGLLEAVMASINDATGGDEKEGGSGGTSKGSKGAGSSYLSRTDKLDLSGLLNVLDGVVDTPNRILVMTTNHPEKLDPALIRPGRIDKKLFLGYMQGQYACQMLQHYFPDKKIQPEQHAQICEIIDIGGVTVTPAQIEQLCAEHEEIDALIGGLASRLKPAPLVRGLSRAASAAMQ